MDKINKTKKKVNKLNGFVKYSSVAFQMGITIGLFTYGGLQLDEYLGNDNPVWVIVFSLSGVCLSIYRVVKDLISIDD